MIKIGNLELPDTPLFLAPMEDVTDPSFRLICKNHGADMVYTEFVSAEALIRKVPKTMEKMKIFENERPVGIQIYGHILENMVEAAKIAASYAPDLVDINCGCPVKKIATRGAGAGLLGNTTYMVKMAEEIVKAVKLPVTVKTRLGWDENSKPIVALAEQLQDVGIKALAIHGRTRAQLYKGEADWTLISEVKNNPRMKIPIIGNGDIDSPEKAAEYFQKYGVDGIMIGRGAIGRPYIFNEIKHFIKNNKLLQKPSIKELVALAKEHFKLSYQVKGEKVGVYEMRRHFANYFKSLPNFKPIRLKLLTSMDYDEILAILDQIESEYMYIDV